MLRHIAQSPSQTLLTLSGTVVTVLFVHSWNERAWFPAIAWLLAAAVCASFALGVRRHPAARLGFLLCALSCATCWRFETVLSSLSPPPGAEYRGSIAREPVRRDGRSRAMVGDVTADGVPVRSLTILTSDTIRAVEGDDITWRCRAEADTFEGFCSVEGPIKTVGHGFHPFLALRSRLRGVVRAYLQEPDASLLLGLLIGDRGGLPPGLTTDFRATGTSHVLAVSGYNVMLVIDAAIVMFALLGLARRRAAAAVTACVIGFVLLAGADPPVMRAGVMGSAGLLAALLGRRAHGTNAFVLTAALMLLADPLALRHDVSFRLSFFAVAGLSAFGAPLEERMRFIPFEGVRGALAETLGATIATLPISLHDFGMLSLASPFTNVMIAPLVPFATATGAAAVVTGSLFGPLAIPAAVATAAALRLMRAIVSWWAGIIPVTLVQAGFWATGGMYAGLGLLWYVLHRKTPDTTV